MNLAKEKLSSLRFFVLSVVVGVGFGLLCAARYFLLQNNSRTPIVWIANGVLLAFLLRQPRRRWWPFLLTACLGNTVFILIVRDSLARGVGVALCNIVEILIALLLLARIRTPQTDLASPPVMFQFLLFAVFLAPAISGFFSAAYGHVVFQADFRATFASWFPAHCIGMAVMTPMVLALYSPGLKKLFGRTQAFRTIGVLLLVLLTSVLVFQVVGYSLRFLWLPLLMLMVFEIGILGAVIAVFEICIIGAVYTAHGHGPLWLEQGATMRTSILFLQLAILVLMVSVVPFAAVVERQRQLRKRLRQGMKRYQLLADNSRDIVVLVNLEGRRLYVSPAVYDVLGWTPEEWTNQSAADFMHREDIGAFQRMLKEMLYGEDSRTFRYRTRHKNGTYLWMEASVRILPEIEGESRAFVANVRDISERVDAEKRLAEAHEHLQQQVQRDSLTQLANRRRFDEVLEKEWRRGRRTGNPLALLMVDIDHFKRINDTYGHRAGDQCLQALATILRRVARRPSDLAARYGGEEFAVLLPDVDLTAASVIADSLCFSVREQLFEAGVGFALTLTVSIGVAVQFPEKGVRADRLVEEADRALYAAKQGGRDRVMPEYDPETTGALLHQVQ